MVLQLSHYALPDGEQIKTQMQLYGMGMAVVDPQGKTNLYSSNQPYEHIREAENMQEIFHNYLSSEQGKSFVDYVTSRGNKLMEFKGVGAGDLGENTVAAILRNDLEGILLSNYEGKSFDERISEMADRYNLTHEATIEYVLAHELAHAAGYKSEKETEGFIKEYFESRISHTEGEERAKYVQLAGVAAERESEMREMEH